MSVFRSAFSPEGFRFLERLKRNNEREWFREHKEEYQALVEEPMKTIVLAFAEGARAKGVEIYAKERSPVMRVYRDVRFSPNKQPYKTHVGADLRPSFGEGNIGVYLHLSPQESFVAAGSWQPDRHLLRTWRDTIVENPERFLKMREALAKRKLPLSQDGAISRMPRGYQQHEGEPFAPELRLSSFIVVRPWSKEECLSSDFVRQLVQFAVAVKPLLEYAREVELRWAKTAPKSKLREEDLV